MTQSRYSDMNSVREYSSLRTSNSLRQMTDGVMKDRTILIPRWRLNRDHVRVRSDSLAHQALECHGRADIPLDISEDVVGGLAQKLLHSGLQNATFAVKHLLDICNRNGQWKDDRANVRYNTAQMFQRFNSADRARGYSH